ncbi:PTS transporter subunit IIC [Bacillaceae bacterium HSR45]|nr:PTS transporter subunit IIC [Bacillaceae bacterium HSR45]
MTTLSKIGPKEFIFRVLSGVAVGIVAGLVPNAILGEIFKYLMQFHPIFKILLGVVQAIQFTVPALVGALIALKFNLTPLAMAVVASASYVGSGAAQFKNGTWVIVGIGDLINTMITASIAVLLILLIEHRVGSMALIVYPTIVGGISATIGVLILPYVHMITTGIGNMINSFTELQPVLMSMLISMVFSFIIISPLSTVAIAIAIGISGIAAGSASIGIAATEAVLLIGTSQVNRAGVPISIFFGGVKMMMPNMVRYPIIMLPILITAAVSGIASGIVGIAGTKESAGFGFIGMVGPINAFKFMGIDSAWLSLLLIIIAFFIVPFFVAWILDILLRKVFKIYTNDIFKFLA